MLVPSSYPGDADHASPPPSLGSPAGPWLSPFPPSSLHGTPHLPTGQDTQALDVRGRTAVVRTVRGAPTTAAAERAATGRPAARCCPPHPSAPRRAVRAGAAHVLLRGAAHWKPRPALVRRWSTPTAGPSPAVTSPGPGGRRTSRRRTTRSPDHRPRSPTPIAPSPGPGGGRPPSQPHAARPTSSSQCKVVSAARGRSTGLRRSRATPPPRRCAADRPPRRPLAGALSTTASGCVNLRTEQAESPPARRRLRIEVRPPGWRARGVGDHPTPRSMLGPSRSAGARAAGTGEESDHRRGRVCLFFGPPDRRRRSTKDARGHRVGV